MGALHAAADRLLRCRSSTMSPHRLRRGASHPAHRRTQFTHAFNLDTTLIRMLLSLRHRFIFIHIYKVAGTSVTRALRPYCRERLPTRLFQTGRAQSIPTLPDHITAQELRTEVRDLFDRCFKFAFVRNPWDWQVSLYHYMKQNRKHPQHALIRNMTFDEYITWRVTKDKHLQKEFVTDGEGTIIVDFVGRFERLEEDFDQICQRIGIRPSLPHRNRSRHDDYRSCYTDTTRELIAEHFRPDIELFDYSFG